MEEIPNVQEVIIKTDKKEIIIQKPSVTEMKSKENSICLGKWLDTPTPNRASIVCFSFKTGSTQMVA